MTVKPNAARPNAARPNVRVQEADFDPAAEVEALIGGRTDVGAVVSFTGLVRGEPGAAMELQHYAAMTTTEIAKITEQALARWPLIDALVIHRFGTLRAGERIVLVATLAAHRGDAFAAAEFLIDWLKTKAPFWKRELGPDDTDTDTDGDRSWVEAKDSDTARAARWDES